MMPELLPIMLSVLGLLQILQLFILTDLRDRVRRLENKYFERRAQHA